MCQLLSRGLIVSGNIQTTGPIGAIRYLCVLAATEIGRGLGDAVDEVRIANGAGETAGAATKHVAKTVANTTVFAAKLGWSVFKGMAEKAAELAAQKK